MVHRLAAIVFKEFRQVRRDLRTLGLLLFLPTLLLVLYGYALSFDVKHIALAVLDQDQSAESRNFAEGLLQSEYFDRVGRLERESAVTRWLDTGQTQAVLIIPADFAVRLQRGEIAPVQALIDGTNAHSASAIVGYLEAGAQEYNLKQLQRWARRAGWAEIQVPLAVESRIYYNPTLESSEFLVPGLIGFLLMVIGAISTSLSVVREKERGTLEQVKVSAVRPGEFILGKTLPYLFILLIAETLILLAARFLFEMPFRGSLLWLGIASLVYLIDGLGFGLWVSSIANTQQVAFQIAALATILPSMILSNLVFPIASMPLVLQWLTYLVPARYFIAIMRGLLLKGSGPEAWLQELILLAVFAVFILGVAVRRLSREMERK